MGSVYCKHCEQEQKPGIWIDYDAYLSHLELCHQPQFEEQAIQSLSSMKEKVKLLLEKFPAARSNDQLLYEKVLQYCTKGILIYDSTDKLIKPANGKGWTFDDFLSFPNYETIRRSRQHIQEKYPELGPSGKVAIEREAKQHAYTKFFSQSKREIL